MDAAEAFRFCFSFPPAVWLSSCTACWPGNRRCLIVRMRGPSDLLEPDCRRHHVCSGPYLSFCCFLPKSPYPPHWFPDLDPGFCSGCRSSFLLVPFFSSFRRRNCSIQFPPSGSYGLCVPGFAPDPVRNHSVPSFRRSARSSFSSPSISGSAGSGNNPLLSVPAPDRGICPLQGNMRFQPKIPHESGIFVGME